MAIETTCNKFGKFGKDSWHTSQTSPVGQNPNVIEPKGAKMAAKIIKGTTTDSVTRGVYMDHPRSSDLIKSVKGQDKLQGKEDTQLA